MSNLLYMNENDITDKRNIKEFKGITFSKYKKADDIS